MAAKVWRMVLACQGHPPFVLDLEQRGADFLIAVNHGGSEGSRVITNRLSYGREAPLKASNRERNGGRDLTWTLRGIPPQTGKATTSV